MTGQVVKFYPADAAKDPDVVLEQASGQFRSLVVAGWNKDGDMEIRADLSMDVADAHLLLAIAQRYLVDFMVEGGE